MESMMENQLYKRNINLIVKKIDQEYIAINADNNNFFTVNETGFLIFKFLFKKRYVAEIVEKLILRYKVNKNTLQEDIYEFLNNCIRNGLIRRYKS